MPFEPYHVYELDSKNQLANAFPFTYFLCMTLPQQAAFSVRHNIVGFPILPGKPRYGSNELRQPLQGRGYGKSQLDVSGEIFVAIDLLQPLIYDIFLPVHRGRILSHEEDEIKEKLRSFLAI